MELLLFTVKRVWELSNEKCYNENLGPKIITVCFRLKLRLVLKLFPYVTRFRRIVRISGSLSIAQPQNELNAMYCSNH
jgi:hypothetical protein